MLKIAAQKRTATAIQVLVTGLFLLGASGCGDGEGQQNKSYALKAAPVDPTAEQDRIDRLQHVILIDAQGKPVETGPLRAAITDPHPVTRMIVQRCTELVGPEPASPNNYACEHSDYDAKRAACMAGLFLAGTADDPGVVTLTNGVGTAALPAGEYHFGIQNVETSAAMARASAALYEVAIRAIANILRSPETAQATACDLLDVSTRHPEFARRLIEYVRDGQTAHEAAQKYTLAAADKQLGSTSAADEAMRRSYTASDLSRAAAARMLTSRYFPNEPLELTDIQSYCGVSELSPQASQALALYRQVGPWPGDVLNGDVSTASFVNYPLAVAGTGTSPGSGSIRQRLIAQKVLSSTSTRSVEQEYSLSTTAFDEARRYLAEELRTFDRAYRVQPMHPPNWAGDLHQVRYANTALPPPDRSFAFYTAIVDSHRYVATEAASDGWPRYRLDWISSTGPDMWQQGMVTPGILSSGDPSYGCRGCFENQYYRQDVMSLAAYRATAMTLGRTLVTRFRNLTSLPVANDSSVLGPLALLAQDPEIEGILSICSDWTTTKMDVVMYGGVHFGEARLLNEVADLECATTGTFEGQPCSSPGGATLGTWSQPPSLHTQRALNFGYTWNDVIGAIDVQHYSYPNPIRPRLYVVVPKYPQDATRRGPGDWRAVAGFAGYLPPVSCENAGQGTCPDDLRCRDIPLIPSLGEQVKKILAPSAENCGHAKVSCTGLEIDGQIDGRMPLENELSDDNNGVESSWKYYLDLAEAAAREADQLGQEYLSNSLSVTQFTYSEELRRQGQQEKAIGAMDRVQSICGTAVEPEALLEQLDTTSSHVVGQTRLNNMITATGTVRSLRETINATPALAKLSECLGTAQSSPETTNSVMHLGIAKLCAWQVNGQVCKGAADDGIKLDCPTPAVNDCTAVPPEVTAPGRYPTATPLLIANGLGLFDPVASSGPPSNNTACAAIRRLARQEKPDGTFTTDLSIIQRWRGLSKELLKRYADSLSYKVEVDDHITVYLDGNPWISTHDNTAWPCGTTQSFGQGCLTTDNATKHSAVFCGWHDCSSSANRGAIIDEFTTLIDQLKGTTWEEGEPMPTGTRRGYYRSGGAVEAYPGTLKNCSKVMVGTSELWTCPDGPGISHFARASATAGPSPGLATILLPSNQYFNIGDYGVMIQGGTKGINYYNQPSIGAFYYAHHTYPLLGQYQHDNAGGLLGPTSVFKFTWAGFDNSFDSPEPGSIVNSYVNPGRTPDYDSIRMRIDMFASGPKSSQPHFYPLPKSAYSGTGDMQVAELVCEAQEENHHVGGGCDLAEFGQITSLANAEQAGRVLECAGDAIIRRAATATFTEVPTSIEDPLRKMAGANVYNTSGGELQEQFGNLRMALAQVALAGPAVGNAVKSIGSDIRQLNLSGKRKALEKEMADVQFDSTMTQQIANCVTAAAQAASSACTVGATFRSGTFAAIGAASTCVNSFAQIHFADKMRDIGKALKDLEFESQVVDFQRKFDDHVYQFQTLSLELQKNLEAVGVALEHIETLRLDVQKQIANAVWYLSVPAGEPNVSNALAARSNLAKVRYERSTTAAKRLAFLAKRAIETRLGTPMREMRQKMPLVEAPSTWESSICAQNGVDLTSIEDQDLVGLKRVADSSVLSYVKKLGNVVESYRLMNGFHEGQDTAVISLRDDIHNIRIGCLTASVNLLKSAGDITVGAAASAAGIWSAEGCSSSGLQNCVTAKAGARIASLAAAQDLGQTPVEHVLVFGTADLPTQATPVPVPPGCKVGTASTCGWQSGARLIQRVDLQPGVYRYSWYGTQMVANDTTTTTVATGAISTAAPVSIGGPGVVIGPDGNPVTADRAWYENITGGTHQRRAIVFTVKIPGQYQVGFSALSSVDGQYQYKVAGPMLERVTVSSPVLGDRPGAYEDGGAAAQAFRMVCEDAEGSKFRTDKWRRSCEYVCPDGYKSNCTDSLVERCFWETDFYISQRSIERNDSMVLSGFARGNYNYRIEEVGLNFVGTGTRDCSTSTTPSTCYSAGFVPYSLMQRGPFYVRNERGVDYQFDLFPGRIEHARGLSAERYLTNPLGSADSQLIASYMRPELRGRPLDGNFVIRIWDEPGVSFTAIDDVQLILKYRYWTVGD